MASQLTGRLLMRCILSAANIERTSVCRLSYHTSSGCAYNSQTCQRNGSKAPSANTQAINMTNKASAMNQPLAFSPVGCTDTSVNILKQRQYKLLQISVMPLPSGLYLSPQSNVAYKLPAHLRNELSEKIIVDPAAGNAIRECPTISPDTEMEDPRGINNVIDMPPLQDETGKLAKITNILIIRRKKMKKHKLRKLRKRMKFLRNIILHRREKRKRQRWEAHLEKFKYKELTDEMIENHLARRARKLEYLTNYLRDEAGLPRYEPKPKPTKKPCVGKIVPTPILPAGAQRW